MARITLDNIAHSYLPNPGGPQDYALRHIDTEWVDGGAYALLGPSGCGKTTMLNIISGLLAPSQGRVLYDGVDVSREPPERRNIAQVFQFPVLYDTMTVHDNLAFPLRNRGVAEADVSKRVAEIADILDLTPVLGKRAAGLTADAKQKISLGRGLVRSDVAAILFDEPLTVIDPHLKWHLRRKLKEIHHQFGLTLIYVTHDQVEALTFADQIVVMYEGEIVQIATPQELFENPEHTFVGYFIGSPGMNLLDCSVGEGGVQLTCGLVPIDPQVLARAGDVKGRLEIGIRPMYLELTNDETPGSVQGRVTAVEDHGNCKVVTVMVNGKSLKARVQEGRSIPADACWVRFPPEKTKVFCDGRLVK